MALPDGLLLQVCVQVDLLPLPLLLWAAHGHCGRVREAERGSGYTYVWANPMATLLTATASPQGPQKYLHS